MAGGRRGRQGAAEVEAVGEAAEVVAAGGAPAGVGSAGVGPVAQAPAP